MAEVGVNIVVDVDIDVYDFMGNCSEFEINEVIEYLTERDKIKFGINHANIVEALTKISTGLLQLTTEEEEYIKALANRLV